MKHLYKPFSYLYIVAFLLFSPASIFASENNTSNVEAYPFKSVKVKNTFLKAIKYHNELEVIKHDLRQLNRDIKKHTKLGNIKILRDLEDQKSLQESKHQILSKKSQEIYNIITTITANNEPFNLLNFFSKKPLHEAEKAISKLNRLRVQYDKAMLILREDIKQLKIVIRKTKEVKKKTAYKYKLGEKLLSKRYLSGFKDLIDKQYDHLLDQRSTIEANYYEYRDSEIMKHVTSIIIILILFILTFIIRKLTIRYVQEDERQFIWRRSISTFAIVIGLTFIVFTYSENIIYSLTIFTFVGAAIVIATRTFLLNIIAWLHIIFSKFIKVGDRIIIPHETKYYHGDVINISPVQITLYETYDFSSTRQAVNAGRIIFIPNNYIFSHGVINYTHHGQKNYYDYLSFNLSFESDLGLTERITREVITEFTSSYVDEARVQFNTLKKRYAIKQRMLEPEVKFDVNAASTGIKMTAWFLTPNSQTTTLKNKLLEALLKRFNNEESIEISKKSKSEKEEVESSSEG
ncbi:MAG: mechanosensitive ion channel family protein [Thiovulaceae bacterium]|nr:mechanosensitive ion channel family protein [Sulfurimonadaceae bacterium]